MSYVPNYDYAAVDLADFRQRVVERVQQIEPAACRLPTQQELQYCWDNWYGVEKTAQDWADYINS